MLMHVLRKHKDKKKGDQCGDDTSKYRLRKLAVKHSLLCFKPSTYDFTFEGSEILQMDLSADTREITVNAVDLVITKAIFEEDITLNRQEPVEIRVEDKGILKLIFQPSLMQQTGSLRMNFKGNMTDKMLKGFFVYDPAPLKQDKVEEDVEGQEVNTRRGNKQLNVMTFMEPCEARRCYPFWDDPAVKVTYDLIIVVPKDSVVIGPTLIKATYKHKRNPNLEVVEFKRTPKLSPHTLGMAFGAFEFVEGRTQDDEMMVRVYTPIGKKSLGEYALNMACKAIPFLQTYFGVPLNSQKLDLVAVPDHVTTPITCYGVIFFRASDLLVEADTALIDIVWISLIICHEITKQWFGCVATFDWWSHQWLKEGVATFAKNLFVHQVFPEMEVWSLFVTNNYQKALRSDGYHFSRAVESIVTNASEIEEAMDDICLHKSPSLLRMVHRFVGDAQFRKGLQTFLLRYQYANGTTTDFWKCMQEATSKPLGTIMGPWFQVRGYPIINMAVKQDSRSRTLKLTQERFNIDPAHRDPKGQSPLWSIPLSFSTRARPTESILDTVMDTKALSVTIPEVTKRDWVKVNPGAIGYFRVRYPHEMMSTLTYAIREKSLPALDRLNILDDSFAFLLAGYSTSVELLSLLEAFVEDDNYSVWMTMSNIFDRCIHVFEHVGKEESFQTFGRYIFQQVYSKLGWIGHDDESILQKLLRPLVIRMMGKFNNMEVVQKCRYLFEGQWGEGAKPIPNDFRYAVYKTVVMHGDDAVLKRFIKLYRECQPGEKKDTLACALGAVRAATQISHVLEFSISDEVQRAHTLLILKNVSKTKLGSELTWHFVKENYGLFRANYSSNSAGKLFEAILEDFVTDEKMNEIQEFFKQNPFPGTEKTIQKIVDTIKVHELWLKREKNLSALQDYLESIH